MMTILSDDDGDNDSDDNNNLHKQMSCLCPIEKFSPYSETGLSRPCFNPDMKVFRPTRSGVGRVERGSE